MRNHDDHLMDAQKALDNGKVRPSYSIKYVNYEHCVHNIQGVKGYSPLHLLPSFDIVKCVPVDYMHCVLIGVAWQSYGSTHPTTRKNGR